MNTITFSNDYSFISAFVCSLDKNFIHGFYMRWLGGGRAVLASVSLSLAALSQTIKTGFMMMECSLVFLEPHRNRYCSMIRVILQQVFYQKCPRPQSNLQIFSVFYKYFSPGYWWPVPGGWVAVFRCECSDWSAQIQWHYIGCIHHKLVYPAHSAHYPPHSVSFLLCQVSRDHHQAFDAFDGSHHLHPRAPGWVSAAVLGAKINKMGKSNGQCQQHCWCWCRLCSTVPTFLEYLAPSKFWVENFQMDFQLIVALLRKVIQLNEPSNLENSQDFLTLNRSPIDAFV